MDKYSIAVVDDHSLVRFGVKRLLQDKNIDVIWEAENGMDMIDKCTLGKIPQLVIMDINMPGMNGVDASAWIKKHHPEIKVLMFSASAEREIVLKLLKIGINGYVLKGRTDATILIDAVQHIHDGDVYFPAFVTKYLLDEYKDDTAKLNAREIEFLQLSATELTYKEIADKMQISARTVEGYREQLFTKLQVTSRVGLVLYAIKHRLVSV